MLTVFLGEKWNLDPSRGEVVFAAAIVATAVLLGVYYAFATDVRTRGEVAIARIETLGEMSVAEMSEDATLADRTTALAAATAATDAAKKDLVASEEQRGVLEGRLEESHKRRRPVRRRWRMNAKPPGRPSWSTYSDSLRRTALSTERRRKHRLTKSPPRSPRLCGAFSPSDRQGARSAARYAIVALVTFVLIITIPFGIASARCAGPVTRASARSP